MKNKKLEVISRKIYLTVGLICVMFFAKAQEPGIKFETNLTWKEIQAKSKAENKYIFMDCFATWCAPCKYMVRSIFPVKEVGDVMNAHFISIAVQMDKTSADNDLIKHWYADADSISKAYDISEYPTYLFFSPDGSILHRFTGSSIDPKEFIVKVQDVLDPNKQYYTLKTQWKSHKGDSVFLRNALELAINEENKEAAEAISDSYIESLKGPLTRDDILKIRQAIYSPNDKAFKFFVNNSRKINEAMDDSLCVEASLNVAIFRDKIVPILASNKTGLSWNEIAKRLKNDYPRFNVGFLDLEEGLFKSYIRQEIKTAMDNNAEESPGFDKILLELGSKYPTYKFEYTRLFLEQKANYLSKKAQWTECANTAAVLINQYGKKLSGKDVNNIAWYYIFLHSDNRKILLDGTKWIKYANGLRPDEPNEDYLDTYANLLYKVGQTKEALIWESKAIDTAIKHQAKPKDLKALKDHLSKMTTGIKTWEDDTPVIVSNTSKN